ncbi:MAG: putative heme-binding domain-containing protein [Phycisphaerales bacterium]|jgi:putative heme-binding domain-containing protein
MRHRSTPSLALTLSITALALHGCGPSGSETVVVVEPPAPENPRLAEGVVTLPGFQAEVLYAVPGPEEGSWVSLCTGPDGTLFASAQSGSVFQITPPPVGDFETPTTIKPLAVDIGNAHGLCWAFDSLYVMVSGSGLHRVTDSDADGELDLDELILPLEGSGEHGPHAVVKHPDGESLLIICGNHTGLPPLTSSRPPRVWGEDQLLPREWDANGHAAGVLAPGGYICRISPDASEVELISHGYRNAYDVAVSTAGDLFTFDSDMEWDMGMPWYRPTRLVHATSGSDFGWRSGSGKFKPSYPDSLPPVADIGPGSPTGVAFGTGAKFPAEFQRAMFMNDWTFGTMYAATLSPNGATYSAEVQEFLSGRPLPLTDLVIGSDGAMYFLTGGRGTQSNLYRVFYYGIRDTSPAREPARPNKATKLRHEMEAPHRPGASADQLDAIWAMLGSGDRFVRYAARVAIENQDEGVWSPRLMFEKEPDRLIQASIALARKGMDRGFMLGLLRTNLTFDTLSHRQKLDYLRAISLCFSRGEPLDPTIIIDRQLKEFWLDRLDPAFPSGDAQIDAELAPLLVYLNAPQIINRSVAMMEASGPSLAPDWAALIARNDSYGGTIKRTLESPSPAEGLHYAFILRTLDTGWTEDLRTRYITWLAKAKSASGGASYNGFIDRMMSQSLASCEPVLRQRLQNHARVIADRLSTDPPVVIPDGPWRAWTVQAAVNETDGKLTGRDFIRGAGLYEFAGCVSCHQFDGRGGAQGPDLSSVGSKFSVHDLLTAIIEPSHDVTDQYAWVTVKLKDGEQRHGRLTSETDGPEGPIVTLSTNAYDPAAAQTIERSQIRSIEPMAQSPMPPGLVNPMNEDELRDLVAYLLSAGDAENAMFD